ncbi:MAG: superinfection immunity protein [Alphaproteobacteria bacterium]|nr:superinfection immunity protein [Alphaproteobacteria bacterium]
MIFFWEFLLILMLFFIYFVPTIVAYSNNHRNVLAIFVLNLFLGYTLVGWVFALIWAVYKEPIKLDSKRTYKKK